MTINQGGDMKFSRLVYMMFFIALSTQLTAQIYQQVPNAGAVNWQNQMLHATGIGSPNPQVPLAAQRAGAIRAATMDALRQMLETVKGMSLTSETTVRNAMIENDVIETQVSGVVKQFKKVDFDVDNPTKESLNTIVLSMEEFERDFLDENQIQLNLKKRKDILDKCQ